MGMATVQNRQSAYVRRLRVGDKFNEDGTTWIVTREPEVIDGAEVAVYLKPLPSPPRSRSRRFSYAMDARVHIVRS
ncbi:hypothetical protein HWC80_gp049 [Mycobacterium phage Indlulamithi]|uniref:Uncharacterized protein n=1 Tax=Mycobacterium phage Indlulamithi TaxID=2656582 RepID=A0A649VD98_9CAUD|nr:hypothetical protein HWC80_gp049 [Mycobacterium phage Indlulamithi]QGJ90089.1 hypothetical protein PBI_INDLULAMITHI_49 [Mycobacterium phage Indlulamithi]